MSYLSELRDSINKMELNEISAALDKIVSLLEDNENKLMELESAIYSNSGRIDSLNFHVDCGRDRMEE